MTASGTRSPAAPSRGLEACYGVASKVYDAYGHTEFGAAEIAAKAGMSADTGSARSLVSDLKQYRLIEKRGAGRFAISQPTKNLATMTSGTSEFMAAAFEFVKNPKVFQDVLASCKGKLPEETAVANNLRSSQQFNEAKAKSTAKALSESLGWAGVLDAKRNILEPRATVTKKPEDGTPIDVDTGLTNDPADEADKLAAGMLSLDIPLAGGRVARVKYPQDLSAEEAVKIGKVLAAISE